jgi:hypothetical protein
MIAFFNTFYNISAIANLPTSQITRTRSILVLVFHCSPLYSVLCPLIISRHGATENTVFCYQECVFIGSLPSNRCRIGPRVCFCWNVFRDPLPSNGHGADHIENTSCNTLSIVAWAYFERCLEIGLHVTIHFDCQLVLEWLREEDGLSRVYFSHIKNFL